MKHQPCTQKVLDFAFHSSLRYRRGISLARSLPKVQLANEFFRQGMFRKGPPVLQGRQAQPHFFERLMMAEGVSGSDVSFHKNFLQVLKNCLNLGETIFVKP